MLPFSHLFITILLAKYMNLKSIDLAMAFFFGVLIDLDHLYTVNKNSSILKNFRGFIKTFFTNPKKLMLRTFLQEPISIAWVILFSILIKNPVPVIFFSIHVGMDYLCKFEKRPFWPLSKITFKKGLIKSGTKEEWILSLLAIFFVIYFL